MKLIYIYFDFTDNGQNPEGYRGFKKCGFNFGTKEYFKMEEPTQEHPNYILSCVPRPEDEQIEPGFWGDPRLYNISALVGDNGVGKSTIIQEIIRCVMGSSKIGKTKHGEDYTHYRSFVSVWENTDGTYMVYHTIEDIDFGKLSLSKNIFINYQESQEEFFGKTKLIYFSNALTGSDSQLLVDLGGPCMHPKSAESHDSYYTHPFYNCSLTADIAQAINVSGGQTASIDSYNDTYFNFRSYQEARYLFDRNQRLLLLDIKKKHNFPVPFPDSITIYVSPAFERLDNFVYLQFPTERHRSYEDNMRQKNFSNLRQLKKKYSKFLENCSETENILSELCINCIVSAFPSPPKNYKALFPKFSKFNFEKKEFYINLLNLIYSSIDIHYEDLYKYCCQYIEFLWNNKDIIEAHFVVNKKTDYCQAADNLDIHIYLGDKINPLLTEFMIRFINFTRAISGKEYFVTYNWGLSSGESNLLHIFTKLRYLLYGNSFDCEFNTEKITEEKAQNASLVQRKEYLTNNPDAQQKCDSVILFFDEADLTLHPEWQRQFVSILAAYLPILYKKHYEGSESSGCKDIQIILSTHSPIMLGDFPSASVIYLKKDKDKNVITVDDQSTLHTFGQNIYTILKEGFYLGEGTVGELARRKIKAVMKDLGEIQDPDTRKSETPDEWKSRLETHQKQTIRYLPIGIIRNKLEEEIAKCRVILGEKTEDLNPDYHLLMQTNKKLLEENIRLQKQLADLKNEGQKHD